MEKNKTPKWSIWFKALIAVIATIVTIGGLVLTFTSMVYARGQARAAYETKVDMLEERVTQTIEPEVKENTSHIVGLEAVVKRTQSDVSEIHADVKTLLRMNGGYSSGSAHD